MERERERERERGRERERVGESAMSIDEMKKENRGTNERRKEIEMAVRRMANHFSLQSLIFTHPFDSTDRQTERHRK